MSKDWQINQNAVPALGRPFQLGMLYDCRTDTLVTGLTLWNKDDTDKATRITPKESSNFQIITKDDFESKKFHIGITASVALSLMHGAIDIKGSAKFYKDTVNSKEHTRMVLQYTSTSRLEQLLISKREKDNLRTGNKEFELRNVATHVVAAIMYGADAFFVFDHKRDEGSSKLDVSGTLEATIKKIPNVDISGSISGGLSKEEKQIADNLSCKFYGDLILDPLPTTYSEAVDAYRTLTHKIGAGKGNLDKTVPMKVWLLPLSALNNDAPKFVNHLSDMSVARAQKAIEEFERIKQEAHHLKNKLNKKKSQFLSFFGGQIEKGIAIIEMRRLQLATELSECMSGKKKLEDVLEDKTEKPFDVATLGTMLSNLEREANTLHELFSLIPSEGKIKLAVAPGDYNSALLTSQSNLLVLEITATTFNPYIDWMRQVIEQGASTTTRLAKQWHEKPQVVVMLRDKIQDFIDFSKTDFPNTIQCIATYVKCESLPDGDEERVAVSLCSSGQLIKTDSSKPLRDEIISLLENIDEDWQPASSSKKLAVSDAGMPLEDPEANSAD